MSASPSSNGKSKRSGSPRRRLALARARLLEQRADLMESLLGLGGDQLDFGGSDLFYRLRGGEGGVWLPLTVPTDRRHGANWPLWRTEPELDLLRQQSRVCAQSNSFAKGLVTNLVNYVVSDGCKYKCAPKKGLEAAPDRKQPNGVEGVVADAQAVVDDFLAANHWSGVIDPFGSLQMGGNKEREIVRRTTTDGELFLRFYGLDDGTTQVRIQGGEIVRQPPGGVEAEGWSYGIRHRMEPFEDVCDPVEYHFAWRDAATGQQSDVAETEPTSPMGELVPASEVLHLKGPDTDSDVKRGTPPFSYDTLEAFLRAAKLQRAASIGAAVRASTAEIWQHKAATAQQVGTLADSLMSRLRTDPETGKTERVERIPPGTIRRVPEGQELASHGDDQTASYLAGAQGDLRQGSTSFCAPEYMTGDASNANFASTKEAGAPWVQQAKALQGYYRAAFLRAVWWAIRWAVERGRLDRRALEWVEVQVEAPTVVWRDELQQAQTDQILATIQVKSPQTAGMERGLDPDREAANFAKAKQQGGGDKGVPGTGGGGPGGPGAPGGGDQQPGPAQGPPGPQQGGASDPLAALGLSEALLLEGAGKGATGEFKTKNGHRYCLSKGKRVPCAKLSDADRQAGERRKSEAPVTVDNLHKEAEALKGARSRLSPEDYHSGLQALAERMNRLKISEVREVAKRLQSGAKARSTMEIVAKIIAHVKRAEEPTPEPEPKVEPMPGAGPLSGKEAVELAQKTKEAVEADPNIGSQRSMGARLGMMGHAAAGTVKVTAGMIRDAANYEHNGTKYAPVMTQLVTAALENAPWSQKHVLADKALGHLVSGHPESVPPSLRQMLRDDYSLADDSPKSAQDVAERLKGLRQGFENYTNEPLPAPKPQPKVEPPTPEPVKQPEPQPTITPTPALQPEPAQAQPAPKPEMSATEPVKAPATPPPALPSPAANPFEAGSKKAKVFDRLQKLRQDVADGKLSADDHHGLIDQVMKAKGLLSDSASKNVGEALGASGDILGLVNWLKKAAPVGPSTEEQKPTAASQPENAPEKKPTEPKPAARTETRRPAGKSASDIPELRPATGSKIQGDDEAKQALGDLLGEHDADVLGAAVNNQPGDTVHLDLESAENGGVSMNVGGNGYRATREIFRDKDGSLVCKNQWFSTDDKPKDGSPSPLKGKGADIFANQVQALRKLGVTKIITGAGRGADMNGYVSWPRMGYSGEIRPEKLRELPDNLKAQLGDSTDVLDLCRTREGADWWGAHGHSFPATFDLTDGSKNMVRLAEYLANRKKDQAPT